jgi:hypothetical protein
MKHFFAAALLICSMNAASQSLPNGGFETWVNNGFYEDPQGWGTYNFLSMNGNPLTATKTTDAHSGTYAIRMESKKLTNNPNPAVYPDTVHTVFTGTLIPTVLGFPYAQRPTNLSLYYKCAPVNNSTAGVLSYLFKWNTSLHRRDTIAVAASYIAGSTTYQQLTVPYIYDNTLTPDTAVIYMSPIAVFTPNQLGAVLIVDDMQFVVPTSIDHQNASELTISFSDGKMNIAGLNDSAILNLYSSDGKLIIKDQQVENGQVVLPLTSGVYLYSLRSGDRTYSGKAALIK